MTTRLWLDQNHRFIEKLISEFTYEGLLKCQKVNEQAYSIKIGPSYYSFIGRINCWGQPVISKDSVSIQATPEGEPQILDSANQLFQDLAQLLPVSSVTWSQFVSECLNTLYSDYRLAIAQQKIPDNQWENLSPNTLHALLNGHPKALPSKGRIGWGSLDLENFSPESMVPMQLHWMAVRKTVARAFVDESTSVSDLCLQSLDQESIRKFETMISATGNDINDYYFLPSHSWQFDHYIKTQFFDYFVRGHIVDLGTCGDYYLPQASLRTVSNISRPQCMDIKLPLTILNTSSYRGLPSKYLEIGPVLSNWLHTISLEDEVFRKSNLKIQKEPGCAYVPHPFYSNLQDGAYHLNELLGVVWRESAISKLDDTQTHYMAASLQQLLPSGKSLIVRWITRSGLSPQKWLSKLFDCTAVPLWHWQCAYGLGFISHGQNLNIVFENFAPSGILIKDIQGDLFVTDHFPQQPWSTLPARLYQVLPKLPPHYLIHNLWTGYFNSVLRFCASILEDERVITEYEFWEILANRLQQYMDSYPTLSKSFQNYDLFKEKMPRLSINRARLLSGYEQRAQRPVHFQGEDIINPLSYYAKRK